MKKIFSYMAAIAAVAGCAKETADTAADCGQQVETVSLTAYAPSEVSSGELTKTVLGDRNGDGSRAVLWNETGETVNINGHSCTAESVSGDRKTATFTAASADEYFAAYPAGTVTSFENGVFTLDLPGTQSYHAGTFDPSAAVTGAAAAAGTGLIFRHCMAYLYLNVKVEDPDFGDIVKIVVKSNGSEPMSGAFTLAFTGGAAAVTAAGKTSAEVCLDCGDGVKNGSAAVVAIPPALYGKGLSVTFMDMDGKTRTVMTDKPTEFKSGTLYTAEFRIAAPAIYNVAGFNAFAAAVNNGGDLSHWTQDGTVRLYADLVFETSPEHYISQTEMPCSFDGNGHTITLKKHDATLFGTLPEGKSIRNLNVVATVTGARDHAGAAFTAVTPINRGLIEDCNITVDGELSFESGTSFSLVCTQNGGTVRNVTTNGSVKLTMKKNTAICYGGGISATAQTLQGEQKAGKFINCTNNADITVEVMENAGLTKTGFGGICGCVTIDGVEFAGCTNNGNISRKDIKGSAANNTCASSLGGICGRSAMDAGWSSNPMYVTVDENVTDAKCYNTKFTSCTNNGTLRNAVRSGSYVPAVSSYRMSSVGGICGAAQGNSDNADDSPVFISCRNTGTLLSDYDGVLPNTAMGGIVGMANAVIVKDSSTDFSAPSSANNGLAGGIIGFCVGNAQISGGSAKVDFRLTKHDNTSYGLITGIVKDKAVVKVSGVAVSGTVTMDGKSVTVDSSNYLSAICVNKAYGNYDLDVDGCTWAGN